MVVSFAVLPWVVTYPTLFPQERCVTTLKTAAQEISHQFSDHVIEIFRFEDEEEYKLRTRFNLKFCRIISKNIHPRKLFKKYFFNRQVSTVIQFTEGG